MFGRSRLLVTTAAAVTLMVPGQASAAEGSVANVEIVDHFDIMQGETPENIVLAPNGDQYLTLSLKSEVIRRDSKGVISPVATLTGDANPQTPILMRNAVMGIVRASDGTLYVNYNTGTGLTGIYRIRQGSAPVQIASFPTPSKTLLNGLALDETRHVLYAADTTRGLVWSVSQAGGTPTIWKDAPELKAAINVPPGFPPAGANGIKFRTTALGRPEVWVSNTTQGTLLNIPVNPNGTAADTVQTRETGLPWIDDFVFAPTLTQPGRVAATLVQRTGCTAPSHNPFDCSAVVLVDTNVHDTPKTILTEANGLSTPTAVVVGPPNLAGTRKMYVTSGAYFVT
ncbi:hypothetical protein, partial [Streptomyces sp. NPDC057910]|uniref:hypothetical protein n=1 Tax=Streptomyces sp. NPDC057910 TaxID=3346278 RepID=UPI0036EE8842